MYSIGLMEGGKGKVRAPDEKIMRVIMLHAQTTELRSESYLGMAPYI
jgi:hypothetical protein